MCFDGCTDSLVLSTLSNNYEHINVTSLLMRNYRPFTFGRPKKSFNGIKNLFEKFSIHLTILLKDYLSIYIIIITYIYIYVYIYIYKTEIFEIFTIFHGSIIFKYNYYFI